MKSVDIKKDFYETVKNSIYKSGEELGIGFGIEELLIYGDNLDENADFNKINLFVKVKIDLHACKEKYQVYDFDKYKSYEYDGTVDAYMDLHQIMNVKNKLNYNGTPIDIDVTVSSYEESGYKEDSMDLQDFTYQQINKRLLLSKMKMKSSDTPNLLNTPEAIEKFSELASGQRNKPEIHMVRTQHEMKGGVLSSQIEHIGDLTHRMAQRMYVEIGQVERSLENIVPKIKSGLNALRSGYGFEREHKENMRPSFESAYDEFNDRFKTFEEYVENELNKISESISSKEKLIARKNNEIETVDLHNLVCDKRLNYSRAKLDLEFKLEDLNSSVNSDSISEKEALLIRVEIKETENRIKEQVKAIEYSNTEEFKKSVFEEFKSKKSTEILLIKKGIVELETQLKERKIDSSFYNDDFLSYAQKTSSLELKFKDINGNGIKSKEAIVSYIEYSKNKANNELYLIDSTIEKLDEIDTICEKLEDIDKIIEYHFEQESKGERGIDERLESIPEGFDYMIRSMSNYRVNNISDLKESIKSEFDLSKKFKLESLVENLTELALKVKNNESVNSFLTSENINIYDKAIKFDNFMVHIDSMLSKYADLHSELTVYNQAQYDGREAAIALGRQDFKKAEMHLQSLQTMIDDESFVEVASQYDKGFDKLKIKQKQVNKRTKS